MTLCPYLSPSHEAFRDSVRRFLETEVAPHAADWEAAGRLPRSLWPRMGELGLLGASLPEQWGGSGGDLFYAFVLLEELPRSLMGGFCAAVSVQAYMATRHILERGSDALRERYVRGSIDGRLVGALGVTEPDAGSDVASLRTRAVREGDSWVVTGAKTFITNGCDGDFVTLAVRTGEPGPGGVSLLVVDLDQEGIQVARRLDKLGWHASDTAELVFDGVRVPADRLIGDEGMGFAYLMEAFQLERLAAAAISVGSARLCLERTADHLRQRTVFGHPLATYQALSHRHAQLAAETEAARRQALHATFLLDRGEPAVRECTIAKLLASELAWRVADACLQAHGGSGYMEEMVFARFLRDARAGTIAGGTSEVMREILARIELEGREPRRVSKQPAADGDVAAEAVAAPVAARVDEHDPESPATVEGLIRSLPSRFRPDKAGDWRATLHFVLAEDDHPQWTVRIADGACHVEEGLVGDSDCVVKMRGATYVGIERGELNPQVAFMTGKVKVSNVAALMSYVKCFRRATQQRAGR